MATLLLLLIYAAFISLGLPDAVLGAGWPAMQNEFGIRYGFAGVVHVMIVGGTIVSSVFTGRLLKKTGTGPLVAISTGCTAFALLGFSLAPSFWWFLPAAIPLGLGAGAVDAGLNAFVAAHYESRHMSWLHCFWGVGALSGPLVLSVFLSRGASWRFGYLTVAGCQALLAFVLAASMRLWSAAPVRSRLEAPPAETGSRSFLHPLKLTGAKWTLVTFFLYCGIESTMGLWGGSFLFHVKGCDAIWAARWVTVFYVGITIGRFLVGFATFQVSNAILVRGGTLTILAGTVLLFSPLPLGCSVVGFVLAGVGCAPVFPCLLHETPVRFGQESAQTLMGFQMAVAYAGAALLPPLFGFAASVTSFVLFPAILFVYAAFMLFGSERVRTLCARHSA